MTKNTIAGSMLEALRCFLEGTKVSWEKDIDMEAWRSLFELSEKHQILPMIYDAVYTCESYKKIPQEADVMLKRQVIRQVSVQAMKTREFLDFYKILAEEGMRPIVVKGIICRNLYREPDFRSSGDEDVLIPWDQFDTYHQAFQNHGMIMVDQSENPETAGEVTYHKKGGLLNIEQHKELFASGSEAYGKFNELFENVFKNIRCEKIQGIDVYTMGHTDHLLYLILHAFKHFLHSGFGIRQVCDIIMYANLYGKEIQWNDILTQCCRIHGELFAAALFDIGEKYLNFDPDQAGYPQNWRELEADGEDLLEDLIDSGIFGDATMSRKHSSNITLQAAATEIKGKSKVSLKTSLFPDKKYMERRYPWLKKYPALLPVAWLSRMFKYMHETKHSGSNSASESIEIGNQRVDLMKKYKIIK